MSEFNSEWAERVVMETEKGLRRLFPGKKIGVKDQPLPEEALARALLQHPNIKAFEALSSPNRTAQLVAVPTTSMARTWAAFREANRVNKGSHLEESVLRVVFDFSQPNTKFLHANRTAAPITGWTCYIAEDFRTGNTGRGWPNAEGVIALPPRAVLVAALAYQPEWTPTPKKAENVRIKLENAKNSGVLHMDTVYPINRSSGLMEAGQLELSTRPKGEGNYYSVAAVPFTL